MSEKEDKRSKQVKVNYRDTLDVTDRTRYLEKMKILSGNDPYELEGFSANVNLLPSVTYPDIVNYLLFTPSPYTLEDLKCYKGTDAHKQWTGGWVSDLSTALVHGKHAVRATVKIHFFFLCFNFYTLRNFHVVWFYMTMSYLMRKIALSYM